MQDDDDEQDESDDDDQDESDDDSSDESPRYIKKVKAVGKFMKHGPKMGYKEIRLSLGERYWLDILLKNQHSDSSDEETSVKLPIKRPNK